MMRLGEARMVGAPAISQSARTDGYLLRARRKSSVASHRCGFFMISKGAFYRTRLVEIACVRIYSGAYGVRRYIQERRKTRSVRTYFPPPTYTIARGV